MKRKALLLLMTPCALSAFSGLLSLTLNNGCARPSQIVRTPPPECRVAAWPDGPRWSEGLTQDEYMVRVGLWVRAMYRIKDDLNACPNITWIPDAPVSN